MAKTSSQRHLLNYCYFGTLFALLTAVHVSHVWLIDEGSFSNRWFYAAYAVGQILFEVGALVLLTTWVSEKAPRFFKPIVISGSFVLFLLHLIDFPLMRIMDMSIWYSFSVVFAGSLDNFIQLLKASNIHLITWFWLGIGIAVLIVFGLLFFYMGKRLSEKKALHFSYQGASRFLVGTLGLLVLFDYHASPFAAPMNDSAFLKALPWKTTFFTQAYPQWNLQGPAPKLPPEAWYQEQLNHLSVSASHKPNIYLFVVESLREDFITSENAPALTQFREQNLSFPYAVSASNGTAVSWFSIFHSISPFEWSSRNSHQWSLGSLPLQIFKKAGYKIHLLSASQLLFYQMDEIIFGKHHSLADDYQVFPDQGEFQNYTYDAQCIDRLIEKMHDSSEGNLFITFLEGTHFDYSWPPDLQLPKTPPAETIDYLQVSYSRESLEGIKNRYRHAIYHIDQQFERFLTALKTHPHGEEAVVVFTSDHGEEFFEEGRLFHASNLNRFQTHVPIYYRLGTSPIKKPLSPLTSHLDIFPTLIDYVVGPTPTAEWFHGESILTPRQKNFVLSARFNASQNPYEFLITIEGERLIVRFGNQNDTHQSNYLELISRKNRQDHLLSTDINEVRPHYESIFKQLFSHP